MGFSENRHHYRGYVGKGIDRQLRVLVYPQHRCCYNAENNKKSVPKRNINNFFMHRNLPLMAMAGVTIERAGGYFSLKFKSSFCDILLARIEP